MVRPTGFEPTTFFALRAKSLRRIVRASHLEVVGSSTSHHTTKQTPPCGDVCFVVRPTGFEPTTSRVGVWHSIQLSYGRIFFLLQLYKEEIFCYNILACEQGVLYQMNPLL